MLVDFLQSRLCKASLFCSLAALSLFATGLLHLRRTANLIDRTLLFLYDGNLQTLGLPSDDHFHLCCVACDVYGTPRGRVQEQNIKAALCATWNENSAGIQVQIILLLRMQLLSKPSLLAGGKLQTFLIFEVKYTDLIHSHSRTRRALLTAKFFRKLCSRPRQMPRQC